MRPDETPRATAAGAAYVGSMEFRRLGNSGLKISEITYGNWLTHGSQIENEQAKACVRAALDAGISPETLRKIESGRVATPSFPTVAAIAEVLGLSLDEVWAEVRRDDAGNRLAS